VSGDQSKRPGAKKISDNVASGADRYYSKKPNWSSSSSRWSSSICAIVNNLGRVPRMSCSRSQKAGKSRLGKGDRGAGNSGGKCQECCPEPHIILPLRRLVRKKKEGDRKLRART